MVQHQFVGAFKMPDAAEALASRIFQRIPPQDCVGLTINDASAYLGCGRSTIYNLINDGSIKSVQVRGRRIVLRASIDDYLKSLVKEGA